MPQSLMLKKLKLNGSMMTSKTFYDQHQKKKKREKKRKKKCSFHHRVLECKVGSQETPGVTGSFGLGVQKKAGQRLTEFCQENALAIENTLFQQHKRRLYTWTLPDG